MRHQPVRRSVWLLLCLTLLGSSSHATAAPHRVPQAALPELYDGGLAGYGFNWQVSQWGSIATVLCNYDVMAPASTTSSRRARPILPGTPSARPSLRR